MTMQKIVPNLWFDRNAQEAVDFYVSVFPGSKINSISRYPQTEAEGLADFQKDFAGKVLSIDFELAGYRFLTINADSTFKPNPSISFFYTCDSKEESNEMWKKLSEGGKPLMELAEYPFSKYYGWVQDKYGYSWQLILNNPEGAKRPKIVPSLLFTKDMDGKAREAMQLYTSVFTDSEVGSNINTYPPEMGADRAGKISYADFRLFDQWFAVMDGGPEHEFRFSPAISFMVCCKDQAEIDSYWGKLSHNPEFEQCGWLQDKFGVSWQITPEDMEEIMKVPGAFKRMMTMKKLDISTLRKAD